MGTRIIEASMLVRHPKMDENSIRGSFADAERALPMSGETEQAATNTGRRDFSHAWRALRHPNFRLFFGGQSISLIGTWMTRIATSWLVYQLTHSALLLGTVSFAGQIPTFLLAPFAGVLVDRMTHARCVLRATSVPLAFHEFRRFATNRLG